jgi:hypothetical protein
MSNLNPFAPKSAAPIVRPINPARPAEPAKKLEVQSLEDVLTAARAFYLQGLGNGDTTHWPCLDTYWTWLKKEITAITGYPNHGKSRLIHAVMLLKAAFSGWRFAVYVPENEEDFYVEMAQMLVGRTANIKFPNNRMALEELEKAIVWVHAHFVVITAPEGATHEQFLAEVARLHAIEPFDGYLGDPWNQLVHDFQSREDLYLSDQFSKAKRFCINHNLAGIYTAHPAGTVKDKNGKLLVPDAYSISGGKMWNNKFDNVMAVFRPAFPDPEVELWIHKIKKRGRVGQPGVLNLTYDLLQSRYFPKLGDTQHPLEQVSFNAPGTPRRDTDFPASEFDAPPQPQNAPF